MLGGEVFCLIALVESAYVFAEHVMPTAMQGIVFKHEPESIPIISVSLYVYDNAKE